MHPVVGEVFWMINDRGEQIIHREAAVGRQSDGNPIAFSHAVRPTIENSSPIGLPHRGRCRNYHPALPAGAKHEVHRRGQAFRVGVFVVVPSVKAIVEVNDGELILLQKRADFLGEQRIADAPGRGDAGSREGVRVCAKTTPQTGTQGPEAVRRGWMV
jgi:hypothetical protein